MIWVKFLNIGCDQKPLDLNAHLNITKDLKKRKKDSSSTAKKINNVNDNILYKWRLKKD